MNMTYPDPQLLKVCFEAPLAHNPRQGLAVAVLADGNVLLQIIDDHGPHSVVMPREGAVGLIIGLSTGLGGATDDELARFRQVIDSGWSDAPRAS